MLSSLVGGGGSALAAGGADAGAETVALDPVLREGTVTPTGGTACDTVLANDGVATPMGGYITNKCKQESQRKQPVSEINRAEYTRVVANPGCGTLVARVMEVATGTGGTAGSPSGGCIGCWASNAVSLAVTAAAAIADAVGRAARAGCATAIDGAMNTSGGVIA